MLVYKGLLITLEVTYHKEHTKHMKISANQKIYIGEIAHSFRD